ncbi:NAD(P)H-dependent oxidoreductase [Campylobacter peloridis]|uniref:NAD(P)H-dependent oxidoreductase n=1 Tax=Campylobacter peloridis TaxID=488546 RepID=A0A5C7DT13_9BACT|nr:NAD(P)H-dependent oxidoreductase [Campylobacter peloridis]TXE78350.1 NAD(P)H-dependent oxidoreductase [Campylobacter peloridis]
MKNILLLNGAKELKFSKGRLNHTLQEIAKNILESLNYNIKETIIDQGYDIEEEMQKLMWADVWIYQMPAWWMGEPWIVKKYIDEIYIQGKDKFFINDGRSSANPSINYGTGGLLQNKKYMFSLTWNAPIEAFTLENEFFDGVGVDMVYLHLHKAHQYMGMSALPTFIVNDVCKNPKIDEFIKNYEKHLLENFKA